MMKKEKEKIKKLNAAAPILNLIQLDAKRYMLHTLGADNFNALKKFNEGFFDMVITC